MELVRFVALTFVGLHCVIGQDFSGSCDEQQAALLPGEDGSRPPCDDARLKIQNILHDCTVDDSVRYVKQSMIFSAVYAKGEDCHNTTGPYPACHLVPKCYSIARKTGEDGTYEFDCGEDNKNVEDLTTCLQRQVEEGCDVIGNKLILMYGEAAKELCSAGNSAITAYVSMSMMIASTIFAFQKNFS